MFPVYYDITMFYIIFILFIYLGFYVAFNTVQVISRWVVGRAEETSTYSPLGFCTVNCRPTASNYQLSHLRPCRESNPGLRGGRRECYHSATVAPYIIFEVMFMLHHRIKLWYYHFLHCECALRSWEVLNTNTSNMYDVQHCHSKFIVIAQFCQKKLIRGLVHQCIWYVIHR